MTGSEALSRTALEDGNDGAGRCPAAHGIRAAANSSIGARVTRPFSPRLTTSRTKAAVATGFSRSTANWVNAASPLPRSNPGSRPLEVYPVQVNRIAVGSEICPEGRIPWYKRLDGSAMLSQVNCITSTSTREKTQVKRQHLVDGVLFVLLVLVGAQARIWLQDLPNFAPVAVWPCLPGISSGRGCWRFACR